MERRICIAVALLFLGSNWLPGQASSGKMKQEATVNQQAKGTFDVKVVPAEASAIGQQGTIGRMTIDKVFSGSLEGSSKGEMLTGITEGTGSMAYVAIERVTGKLGGRSGTFVLMHTGTMIKSQPDAGDLNVVVVPASGTGELAGLTGKMTITIDQAGKHTYEFQYSLN